MLVGKLDEFFQGFKGIFELFGKFRMLLVLPGITERGKPRLQRAHPTLKIPVKTL